MTARELAREAVAQAAFNAIGWTTRKADTAGTYGLVHPLPQGLVTGDPDNPEWAKLASRLLAALDAPARAELLAWLLPEDRLAAALPGQEQATSQHGVPLTVVLFIGTRQEAAQSILAALTDPATDGGVK